MKSNVNHEQLIPAHCHTDRWMTNCSAKMKSKFWTYEAATYSYTMWSRRGPMWARAVRMPVQLCNSNKCKICVCKEAQYI